MRGERRWSESQRRCVCVLSPLDMRASCARERERICFADELELSVAGTGEHLLTSVREIVETQQPEAASESRCLLPPTRET